MLHLPTLPSLRVGGRRRSRPGLDTPRQDRPQVVAHRGSSNARAEHTLSAYVKALEEGAEGLECDVRLTADGHLVCVHDRRVDRTSTGRGPVSSLELSQLKELDFASWKRPWKDFDDEAEEVDTNPDAEGSILTLEHLLDMVYDWDRPVDLAIETKHPTRYAGLVESRLIQLLDRYGWARPKHGQASPARVMSFSWMSLRRCLEMAPGLQMVYLMERVPLRYRDGTLPLGAGIAGPSIALIRAHPEYVARAHHNGHEVHVHVVNEPADVALCSELGVDAVITDVPGRVLKQLS